MDTTSRMVCATSTVADGNMDFRFGEARDVLQNRRNFLSSMHVPFTGAVAMQSLHEDTVVVVGPEAYRAPTSVAESVVADALITKELNCPLLLTTADCLPVVLCDNVQQTIALIHLSRHTFQRGLIAKAFAAFSALANTVAKQVNVVVGPHIHAASYRFPLPLTERAPALEPFITEKDGYAHIDLARAACVALDDLGIPHENISVSTIDTVTSAEHFSHVRSVQTKAAEGRLLTAAALTTT